jgi:hypothetical protein
MGALLTQDEPAPVDERCVWGRAIAAIMGRIWMGRKRRRLTHGEQQLLDHRVKTLTTHWRPLTQVIVLITGICVVELVVLPGAGEYRGFLAGGLAATTFWLVVLNLRQATYAQTVGVEGERRSRELLDGVPQWFALHDLPLDARNIDHVVVTPLAVLAVETKWWGTASVGIHAGRREAAVVQAGKNARTLRHLLKSCGFDLPVRPVVLTWGPGAEASVSGGIDVVDGEDSAAWIAAHQVGAVHTQLAADVYAALLQSQSTRDQHRRQQRQTAA